MSNRAGQHTRESERIEQQQHLLGDVRRRELRGRSESTARRPAALSLPLSTRQSHVALARPTDPGDRQRVVLRSSLTNRCRLMPHNSTGSTGSTGAHTSSLSDSPTFCISVSHSPSAPTVPLAHLSNSIFPLHSISLSPSFIEQNFAYRSFSSTLSTQSSDCIFIL